MSTPQCKEIWYQYLEMSTDPKHVENILRNSAENKVNRYEELVFDKTTMKLMVKKKEDIRIEDTRVFREMTKAFNLVVWKDVEEGED